MSKATGPLKGVRIVEFAGIGPGPMAWEDADVRHGAPTSCRSSVPARVAIIPGQFVNRGRRNDRTRPRSRKTSKPQRRLSPGPTFWSKAFVRA